MNSKIFTLFISTVLFSAGALAQGVGANISSEEINIFLEEFGTNNAAAQKEWKQFVKHETGTGEKIEGVVEHWLQPFNKKIACKLFVSGLVTEGKTPWFELKDTRVYWDGDCQNGYAYGIGREFAVIKGEVLSLLAEYNGERKRPIHHLWVSYDRQVVKFMGESHPYYASLRYSVQQGPTGKRTMRSDQVLFNLSEDRIYRKNFEVGGDNFEKAVALPNRNTYVMSYNVNPATPFIASFLVNGSNERIGYSIASGDNGINKRVRHQHHLSNGSNVDVILPESYRRHLSEVGLKIDSNLSIGDRLIQEAYVAISKYKRRICKGDVRVDFIDNELYGRICLENGELGPYAALFSDAQTQQEKRHIQAREDISRQKEEHQRRSDDTRRQAAQEQQTRNEGMNNFAQDMNNFAQEMGALHQNSAQFTRSMMNSLPAPSVNFGQPQIRTNCIRIGNIVNCRSQ